MTLIPARESRFIRDHLARHMTGPVAIDLYTRRESRLALPGDGECPTCKDTRELLEELAALSAQIRLEVHDFAAMGSEARALGIDRIPAFTLTGAARGRVRYFGIPAGYEFATLIEDLVDVSQGTTGLSARSKLELESLDRDVHIQVLVTSTCPYCPGRRGSPTSSRSRASG